MQCSALDPRNLPYVGRKGGIVAALAEILRLILNVEVKVKVKRWDYTT